MRMRSAWGASWFFDCFCWLMVVWLVAWRLAWLVVRLVGWSVVGWFGGRLDDGLVVA